MSDLNALNERIDALEMRLTWLRFKNTVCYFIKHVQHTIRSNEPSKIKTWDIMIKLVSIHLAFENINWLI